MPLLSRRLGLPIRDACRRGSPSVGCPRVRGGRGAGNERSDASPHRARADPVTVDGAPATRSSAPLDSVHKWTRTPALLLRDDPAKWDWSLSKAVAKWNASGGRIKLVRTISRSKAKVNISYGNIGERRGPGHRRLDPRRVRPPELDVRAMRRGTTHWNRIAVMTIFAHELGHVLGLPAHARPPAR